MSKYNSDSLQSCDDKKMTLEKEFYPKQSKNQITPTNQIFQINKKIPIPEDEEESDDDQKKNQKFNYEQIFCIQQNQNQFQNKIEYVNDNSKYFKLNKDLHIQKHEIYDGNIELDKDESYCYKIVKQCDIQWSGFIFNPKDHQKRIFQLDQFSIKLLINSYIEDYYLEFSQNKEKQLEQFSKLNIENIESNLLKIYKKYKLLKRKTISKLKIPCISCLFAKYSGDLNKLKNNQEFISSIQNILKLQSVIKTNLYEIKTYNSILELKLMIDKIFESERQQLKQQDQLYNKKIDYNKSLLEINSMINSHDQGIIQQQLNIIDYQYILNKQNLNLKQDLMISDQLDFAMKSLNDEKLYYNTIYEDYDQRYVIYLIKTNNNLTILLPNIKNYSNSTQNLSYLLSKHSFLELSKKLQLNTDQVKDLNQLIQIFKNIFECTVCYEHKLTGKQCNNCKYKICQKCVDGFDKSICMMCTVQNQQTNIQELI